jgi:uncharacterized membrane protein YphA (DoxX/SURF4 family)
MMMTGNRNRRVAFWLSTALTALAFAGMGAADLGRAPAVVAGLAHLGYPAYLATILGVWKLLGAAAIVSPGLPRLKEWAYAGMLFDLTGAAASHAAMGGPAGQVAAPLVLLALAMTSRTLWPAPEVAVARQRPVRRRTSRSLESVDRAGAAGAALGGRSGVEAERGATSGAARRAREDAIRR